MEKFWTDLNYNYQYYYSKLEELLWIQLVLQLVDSLYCCSKLEK